MGWTVSAVSLVVFGGALVATAVGVTALRKRPESLAWPLAVTMFAVAAWAIPHAVGLGFDDVATVTFWQRMRYPGTVVAPVAYLVVTLTYAGHDRWLSKRIYAALGAVPALTVALVWTNPQHGLFWRSRSIASVGDASVFVPEFGPWYWVNLGYLYAVVILGLAVLGLTVIRVGTLYRKQAALLFVGGLVPFLTNTAITAGLLGSPAVDFTTTAMAVSGATFALALFHYDLLELRPVARERLVDELEDGVVVIGPNERIRDFNPTATAVLGDIAVDQPAEEVLPTDVAVDGGEIVAEIGDEERRFRTLSSPLTDEHGRDVGRIVRLDDITELVEREQRISVLNRVLRHNVRNELNVVAGHLEMLAAETESGHVETAAQSTHRVLELAEKARHVDRALRERDATALVPVAAVLTDAIGEAGTEHPDADIEYVFADETTDAAVRVVDAALFELALGELLDNAVVHNDREPRVTVRVETAGERVEISVADNGPGIPEAEREIVASRTETQLEHGSGLGLWLVAWLASGSAGDLSFGSNEPRGSVVTLSLPRAGE